METEIELSPWESLQVGLEAMYTALSSSVTDPITVETGMPSPYDRMYCDCMDDEEKGRETVRGRVRGFRDTLTQFIAEHRQIEKILNEIETGASQGNGDTVRQGAKQIVSALESHASHIGTMREAGAGFLSYPVCCPGHYHVGKKIVVELAFSLEPVAGGPFPYVQRLSSDIEACEGNPGFSTILSVSEGSSRAACEEDCQLRGTWADNSYSSRIMFVESELKKCGL